MNASAHAKRALFQFALQHPGKDNSGSDPKTIGALAQLPFPADLIGAGEHQRERFVVFGMRAKASMQQVASFFRMQTSEKQKDSCLFRSAG